jgi:hypothetical protein
MKKIDGINMGKESGKKNRWKKTWKKLYDTVGVL